MHFTNLYHGHKIVNIEPTRVINNDQLNSHAKSVYSNNTLVTGKKDNNHLMVLDFKVSSATYKFAELSKD